MQVQPNIRTKKTVMRIKNQFDYSLKYFSSIDNSTAHEHFKSVYFSSKSV